MRWNQATVLALPTSQSSECLRLEKGTHITFVCDDSLSKVGGTISRSNTSCAVVPLYGVRGRLPRGFSAVPLHRQLSQVMHHSVPPGLICK